MFNFTLKSFLFSFVWLSLVFVALKDYSLTLASLLWLTVLLTNGFAILSVFYQEDFEKRCRNIGYLAFCGGFAIANPPTVIHPLYWLILTVYWDQSWTPGPTFQDNRYLEVFFLECIWLGILPILGIAGSFISFRLAKAAKKTM